MHWKKFKQSNLTSDELKEEVEKLKKSEEKTKTYSQLQNERDALLRKIKKEGWSIRHRKALNTLNKLEGGLIRGSKFSLKEGKSVLKGLKTLKKKKHHKPKYYIAKYLKG